MSDVPADDRGARDRIEALGRLLFRALPEHAERIDYHVCALAPFTQSTAAATEANGSRTYIDIGDEIDDLAVTVREQMYRPGAGAWFTAQITVTREGSVDADFDYDNEPGWLRPVEPLWYVQDLERFPRNETAVPEWLRQRITEGS